MAQGEDEGEVKAAVAEVVAAVERAAARMTELTPPTRTAGRVLVVGVSDASGATGIQAAIKSISALGAFACATVAAVIAEDVEQRIPPVAVAAQMRAVLADIGTDVLVVGGLSDPATVEAVADVLDGEARGIPVVLDLAEPTTAELSRLARIAIAIAAEESSDIDTQKLAATRLSRPGHAAFVTSAHGDVLADGATLSVFPPKRGTDRPVRGRGMSLAAAIGAGLAQGLPLAAAVRRGRDYVDEAILTAPEFGRGASPLNHVHTCRHTPAAAFET